MNAFWETDIVYLKGVGPFRANTLKKEFGIGTMRELLYYFPFRYLDKSRFYKIQELEGEMPAVQIRGRFLQLELEGEGARMRLRGVFTTATG